MQYLFGAVFHQTNGRLWCPNRLRDGVSNYKLSPEKLREIRVLNRLVRRNIIAPEQRISYR